MRSIKIISLILFVLQGGISFGFFHSALILIRVFDNKTSVTTPEVSSRKVLKLKLDLSLLELRFINPSFSSKKYKRLAKTRGHPVESGKFWFASFGNLDEEIKRLRENGSLNANDKIRGKFRHGNFSGPSVFFLSDTSTQEALEECAKGHHFGNWDYIQVEKGSLDCELVEIRKNLYTLVIKNLTNPVYEWDD